MKWYLISLLLIPTFIYPASGFKAARKKREIKLKMKVKKQKQDEAKKRALARIKKREQQRVDLYALTDEDLAAIEQRERAINQKSEQQIQMLEQMLTEYQDLDGETKAEKMFQLAELKWQNARYSYLKARKGYEDKLETCLESGKKSCKFKEPIASYDHAIKHYLKILKTVPEYSRVDEVLYYLAYGLQRIGKSKDAEQYYQQIIDKHSKSGYLPNAYMALGEFSFEKNWFLKAKGYYTKVTENKQSEVYDLARYKLGWTHYNIGANEEGKERLKHLKISLDHFKHAIEHSQKAISFKTQAKNDLILVMSEFKDSFDQVKTYFHRLGGDQEVFKRLKNLGELLLAQGKDEQVITVYRYLITTQPTAKEVPEYYTTILESQIRLNNQKKIKKVYREAIDYFAPGSKWVVANSKKPYFEEGFDYSRKMLQNQALTYHEMGQKCKGRRCNKLSLYRSAAALYKEYIKKYPKTEEAYKDSFYYAEIQFYYEKDYRQAANYYEKVFKHTGAKAYFADAAFGMILALEKLMSGEMKRLQQSRMTFEQSKQAGALKQKKKANLTDLQRQYILACDTYIKVVKSKKEKPKVEYGAARLFYENGHYKQAINRFQKIIKTYKGSESASLAGNLILDTYNRLRKFSQIERWSEILLKSRNYKYNPKKKLMLFIRQSILKQGEEAVKAQKYTVAAEHFKRLAADKRFVKNPEIAAVALNQAASAYGLNKDEHAANQMLHQIIKQYPKSHVAAESLLKLGNVHNIRAMFLKAADYYTQLSRFPKWKETPNALFNAITLYAAIGKPKKALRLINIYIKLYKRSKDSARRADIEQLKLKRGTVFEYVSNEGSARKAYLEYIKKYPKRRMKRIQLNLKMGVNILRFTPKKGQKADQYFNKAKQLFEKWYQRCKISKGLKRCKVTYKPKSGSRKELEFIQTKNMIGEQLFKLVEPTYQRYETLANSIMKTKTYKQNSKAERRMQKQIQEMFQIFGKLHKHYDLILNYESPLWSVAASYRLGRLPHLFAETLYKAPTPKGLSEDEEMVYRDMLDEKAEPLQESALTSYEAVLSFVQSHKWYNSWYREIASQIVKFEGKSSLFPAAGYHYQDEPRMVPFFETVNTVKEGAK